MSKVYLTTFEAAELLSVTPDSVLKWIKSGKLVAHRTPGGHNRIARETIEALLKPAQPKPASQSAYSQYCWEYNFRSWDCNENCTNCVVYKARVKKCYVLSGYPEELGPLKRFCESSCDQCEYYKLVKAGE